MKIHGRSFFRSHSFKYENSSENILRYIIEKLRHYNPLDIIYSPVYVKILYLLDCFLLYNLTRGVQHANLFYLYW